MAIPPKLRPQDLSLPVLLLLLTACASPGLEWAELRGLRSSGTLGVANCARGLEQFRERVERSGAFDAEASIVPGFPYLRANRFLAAFAESMSTGDPASFRDWVGRMRALDRRLSAIEFNNLVSRDDSAPGDFQELENCAETLLRFDLADKDARAALASEVAVPDEYALEQRILGLYPLPALAVLASLEAWKAENLASFLRPLAEEKAEGRVVVYRPPERTLTQTEATDLVAGAPRGPLDVPLLDQTALQRLALAFAPVWSVDETGHFDQIGYPVLRGTEGVGVDPSRPTVFYRHAHTFLDGRPALQFVYWAWFDERPKTGPLDVFGGRLDAVIWRVTLDHDGSVALFDSIHACGCYHLFFPGMSLSPRSRTGFNEGIVVAAPAPDLSGWARPLVHLATRTHYLRAVGASDGGEGVVYRLVHEDVLHALPDPSGGHRGLYGPDGIVRGTQRLERFLLWPFGITSPGAMRQWGRHATAFVGLRHFDDPHLIDDAFEWSTGQASLILVPKRR